MRCAQWFRNATFLAVTLLTSGCAALGSMLPSVMSGGDRLAGTVTITRDEWGVPHVHGETAASAAFGVAYAQAEDAYSDLEESYIHALGRAAHWYGDAYLAADLMMAAFEVERLSREEYAREPRDRQQIWAAYAAGLNYYRDRHGVPVRAIAEWEPWMPFALVRAERIALLDSVAARGDLRLADAGSAAYPMPGVVRDVVSADDVASSGDRGVRSFTVAIAPARSASGNAMLLHAREHAFADHGRSYEMHVRSDDGWHVSGVALLGTPVPRAGYNGALAWGHGGGLTAKSAIVDVATGSELTEWQDTVLVNTHEGVVQRVYRFRRTADGPVVLERDGGQSAVRVAGMVEGGALQQWYAMGRATDLASFEVALGPHALPVVGTVVADTAGSILGVRHGAGDDGSGPLRVLNPESGAVVIAGVADDGGHGVGRLIGEAAVWTADELAGVAFDTRMPGVSDEVQRLVLEWEQVGGTNPARAMTLDSALAALRAWDGTASPESTAATLFVLWQQRLRAPGYEAGFGRFRAMEEVLAGLAADWPGGAAAWGEVNRLQRPRSDTASFRDDLHSLPVAAVPWWTGAGSNFVSVPVPGARRRYGVQGYAWVGMVELSAVPAARSVAVYGQSAVPASPHFFDQAELYARGLMKNAWFADVDVAANARRVYRPDGTPP